MSMSEVSSAATCHCGAPGRGLVDAVMHDVPRTRAGIYGPCDRVLVPAHFCRQCCADHCEMDRYLAGQSRRG